MMRQRGGALGFTVRVNREQHGFEGTQRTQLPAASSFFGSGFQPDLLESIARLLLKRAPQFWKPLVLLVVARAGDLHWEGRRRRNAAQ
jgi:hypothetical protein